MVDNFHEHQPTPPLPLRARSRCGREARSIRFDPRSIVRERPRYVRARKPSEARAAHCQGIAPDRCAALLFYVHVKKEHLAVATFESDLAHPTLDRVFEVPKRPGFLDCGQATPR